MPPRKPLKPIKILIIGNGFDLANGLPTTYRDFLEFCEKVSYIFEDTSLKTSEEYYNRYLQEWEFNEEIKRALKNIFVFKNKTNEEYVDFSNDYTDPVNWVKGYFSYLENFYECIKENLWYKHFQGIIKGNSKLGKNWIDFESEIAEVILTKEENKSIYINMQRDLRVLNDEMPSILLEHLNKLTYALEIYLSAFVTWIKPKIIKDLKIEKFDYILSFNYTDTFINFYKENYKYENFEICHIHGRTINVLFSSAEICNLVLGIDDKEGIDDEQFLPFKKFYQRIIKKTENNYSDWLDEIKNSPDYKYELHIFGHSLDVTDKDILKAFILNDNVDTKIYYYRKDDDDKVDFGSKIKNLIKIIGKDEVIRRTSNSTIKFVPQKLAKENE